MNYTQKKLLCVFLMLFAFTLVACTNTVKISDIEKTATPPAETPREYSDEEIYDAFNKAYDFYYTWIYGQYYIDSERITEDNGKIYAPVVHNEIQTVNDITQKIQSCFSEPKASEFISFLNPFEKDGELYINCNMGVGDNGIEFDKYTIEKVDASTYILTLNMKFYFDGSDIKSQVICKIEDGKILFDDYTQSPFANDPDYIYIFE